MKYIPTEKLIAEIVELRKELPDTIEHLNDEESGFARGQQYELTAIEAEILRLQQEQPEAICSKCIHHGKDDDYCYNPHGGIQSLINENGVYECTGFCEQEQPEIDLDEEIYFWIEGGGLIYPMSNKEKNNIKATARHFYELGYNARK